MRFRLVLSVIIVTLSLVIADSNSLVASTVTKTKSPKIGFVLSTTQEERYQKDRKVFEETVTSLGGSVLFVTCENNEQLQLSEVEALISQGINRLYRGGLVFCREVWPLKPIEYVFHQRALPIFTK